MIAVPKKKKRKHWIAANQAEVAEFFRVTIHSVAQWRSKGMPGKPGRYEVDEILEWLLTAGPWSKRVMDASTDDEDQLLLGDSDSPALERFRLARAKLSELELEERRDSLIPRDRVRNGLSRFATILRQLGERLGQRYGPEATLSINDALDDCQRVVDDEFGGNGLQHNGSC